MKNQNFDQAPYCQSEKDFEKLLPWNIKITEFHEEGLGKMTRRWLNFDTYA